MINENTLGDTVSGFSDISTFRYEGFTERNITDFMNILLSIENDDKYQKMTQLFEKLRMHMQATNDAHTFDLKGMEDGVLGCLYKQYRKHGYKGTVKDMLNSVIKTIKVAEDHTVKAGVSLTEAESVISFSKMMKEHFDKDYAHRQINDTFNPTTCINNYPYLILDYFSDTTKNSYVIDNIINRGAIYFELWYKKNRNQGNLFSVVFKQGTLVVKSNQTGIEVDLDNRQVVKLDYPSKLNINKYVLTISEEGVKLRDEISKAANSNTILSNASNIVFSSNVLPIGGATRNCSDGINKVYVYDYVPTEEEQTYLLN